MTLNFFFPAFSFNSEFKKLYLKKKKTTHAKRRHLVGLTATVTEAVTEP